MTETLSIVLLLCGEAKLLERFPIAPGSILARRLRQVGLSAPLNTERSSFQEFDPVRLYTNKGQKNTRKTENK